VQQRHGQERLRHVPGAFGRLPREARILLQIVDHDRLPGDQHPARDAGAGGKSHSDEVFLALPRDGFEHKLVRRLVVEEHG
jgi:hypothetical protein